MRDRISDLNLKSSTARTGHVAAAANAGALNSSALTHAAARSGRLARAHIGMSTAHQCSTSLWYSSVRLRMRSPIQAIE